MPLNVEIKACCRHEEQIRKILKDRGRFVGNDHQIDSYFEVPNGRLKLREGDIEKNLIHYCRVEVSNGPKRSDVELFRCSEDSSSSSLKAVLSAALGVKVVVDKQREIWFIDNVKIHLDSVEGLDEKFVEIEAIDVDGSRDESQLYAQCKSLMAEFHIIEKDLYGVSYCDMLLQLQKSKQASTDME